MTWDEMAVVGRIARPHGIKGQVIVNAETDFPEERFRPGARLFVQRRGVAATDVSTLVVATARFQNGRPVLGFEGIADIPAAEPFVGSELRVPSDELAELPPGMYYRHSLIDCVVETTDGIRVGVVESVEGTLAGSRLVVRSPRGEVLVPMVAAICRTIDPSAKRIVIAPPDGLLDVNLPGA